MRSSSTSSCKCACDRRRAISERLLAEKREPPHQPSLGRAEVGARMQGAAIVPEQEVMRPPHVLVNELGPLLMIEQRAQEILALGARHILDRDRHQAVHIQSLPAGRRVSSDDRMPIGWNALAKLRAPQGRSVVVIICVQCFTALNRLLDRRRKCFVSQISVCEQRVPACAGNLQRVQHRCRSRPLLMALIGVKVHLAVRQGADELAILPNVGYQHHCGVRSARMFCVTGGGRSEQLSEANLVVLGQVLIAQEDDKRAMPYVQDLDEQLVAHRLTYIDPDDLGTDCGRQRPDTHAVGDFGPMGVGRQQHIGHS